MDCRLDHCLQRRGCCKCAELEGHSAGGGARNMVEGGGALLDGCGWGMSLPSLLRYWVDGLHMTPRGYDKMADIIFDSLKQYL